MLLEGTQWPESFFMSGIKGLPTSIRRKDFTFTRMEQFRENSPALSLHYLRGDSCCIESKQSYSAKTLVCAYTNSHQNRHDFEQSHNAAVIKCSQISMRLFNYS
jgi:hypothetical protein